MHLIQIYFRLVIGQAKYTKTIWVESVPKAGELLKVAQSSFIVTEVEHDLDAYENEEFKHGSFCITVKAKINDAVYSLEDRPSVVGEVMRAGWKGK